MQNKTIEKKVIKILGEFEKTPEAKKQHELNKLHQYCRRIEHYIKQGYPRNKAVLKVLEEYKNKEE
jgi:hypothetical protein